MKYRKKPIVVEAEQFRGFYATPYPPGVEMEDNSNSPGLERYRFYVTTIHGQKVYIEPGDWIIQEPNKVNLCPCEWDVFASSYDLVG